MLTVSIPKKSEHLDSLIYKRGDRLSSDCRLNLRSICEWEAVVLAIVFCSQLSTSYFSSFSSLKE
jgi:hypothetical protein